MAGRFHGADMNTDRILVAGAGPVGLVVAVHLAQHNIPVTVLEAEADLPETLRASTFHPPTLDMLESTGVLDAFLALGLKAPTLQYRERAGCIAEFDFGQIADVTAHPYRLQCEQFKLNRLLYEKLMTLPGTEVRFSSEVTAVEEDATSVTAVVGQGDETRRFTGRYLVGADGARSNVRKSLDIAFDGFTWPERFLVVSTPFRFDEHFDRLAPVSYFADPDEWFFLLRIPGLWRVMFPTRPEESDDAVLSDASVERRLQGVVRTEGLYPVEHRTLYPVHQRVAARYRKGRAFLAGDAAHINNPLGGMGLNGGIHDGYNLAERLVRVWRGEALDAELDGYERQRRPIALEYANVHSTRNKLNLEARDPERQERFRRTMRETAADPKKSYDYLLQVSMIASLRQAAGL